MLLVCGCSGGDNDDEAATVTATPEEESSAPFQELLDQGIDRYLGMYSPSSSSETDGVVNYFFGEGGGPLCLEGGAYTMATRDQGSQDLMIFLQGGGACWFDLCSANQVAETGIIKFGLLDPDSAINPAAGWNTVYLPYCDGGLHASDSDVDSDGDGVDDRFHRGLHNTSAALDVAVQTFPAPRRILLAGVSGGGYGTLFSLPLVRHLYPGVPITVLNDSGIGISRPDDREFNESIYEYWNITSFLPASCTDCFGNGEPTELIDWQLGQDDNYRLALMSHTRDFTIATFFLGIGGPVFESILRDVLTTLESWHPQRVKSFLRNGTEHTFLGDLSLSAGGVTVAAWLSTLLEDPENLESVADEGEAAP